MRTCCLPPLRKKGQESDDVNGDKSPRWKRVEEVFENQFESSPAVYFEDCTARAKLGRCTPWMVNSDFSSCDRLV